MHGQQNIKFCLNNVRGSMWVIVSSTHRNQTVGLSRTSPCLNQNAKTTLRFFIIISFLMPTNSAQHNSRLELHVRKVMINIVLVRLQKLLVDSVDVFKIARLLE